MAKQSEKRVFPRTPLDLPGEFQSGRIGSGGPVGCHLLDFSFGGIHIEFNTDPPADLRVGGTGMVSFVSTESASSGVHYLRVRICRLQERLAGCSFAAEPNAAARKALDLEARRTSESRQTGDVRRAVLSREKAATFIDGLWERIHGKLDLIMRSMIPQLHAELVQESKQVLEEEERKAFMEALGELSLQWDQVYPAWLERVHTDLSNLKSRKLQKARRGGLMASADQGLSLVGNAEVEATLNMQSLVLEAERYHRDLLSLINQALGLAAGCNIDDSSCPLGPALITENFHAVASHLYPHPRVQKVFLETFKLAVLMELDSVYKVVDEELVKWDLRARAEAAAADAKRSFLRPKRQEPEPAKPAGPQAEQQGAAAPQAASGGLQGTSDQQAAGDQQAARQGESEGAMPALDTSRLSRLLADLTPGSGAQAPAADGVESLTTETLNSLLSSLPTMVPPSGTTPFTFVEWLQKHAEEADADLGPIHFSPEQQASIELVEKLFDTISMQDILPEQTVAWLRRLQVPILGLVLRDPEFLESADHPGRQMLNQLARIGGDSEISSSGLDQTLDQYVQRVVDEHQGNPEVFSEVLSGLKRIVKNRQEVFLGNVRRLQHSQEGRERLVQARRQVGRQLREMLGTGEICSAIMSLVDEAWANLMVNALVSDGPDSERFRRYRRVIEILARWLPVADPPILTEKYRAEQAGNVDKVLAVIQAGIEEMTADPFLAGMHHDNFAKLLKGPLEQVPQDLLAPCRIDSLVIGGQEDALSANDVGTMTLFERGLVRRLSEVDPGTVILLNAGTPRLQRCRLAWKAADLSRLVLSDDRGGNLQEFTLEEFIRRAEETHIEILDAQSDSLVDTGLLEAIQRSIRELSLQGERDELTGALTRRDFLRHLDDSLVSGRGGDADACLLLLNVDWFDLLNNEIGHAAADRYLADLFRLIRETVPATSLVGRVGVDEFGILLPETGATTGGEIAERLRGLVADRGFFWDDREIKVTASLGMVLLKNFSGGGDRALQHVTTACAQAKEKGRNRVEIAVGDDTVLEQRQRIKTLATQVHELVSEERLGLRLQPIVPIAADDAHHHHEALLLLRDEDGEIVSPQDFIVAAESYGHVQEVDRWVVTTALGWMADHPEYMERLGGMAINLSGHSVNDSGFLDFLLAEVRNSGIDPERASFEITETAMVSNIRQATEFIHQVRAEGCRFALDDFGAGMSSYAYLKTMPVDYLKIDGIFIREIVNVKEDHAVVRSINEVAHFMGIRTIAEYVEDGPILEELRKLHVDYAQGWHVGKPVPLVDFERACAEVSQEVS